MIVPISSREWGGESVLVSMRGNVFPILSECLDGLLDRFDFVRTCCFNRTSHVLYMKQPTEFQVIKDNVYIGIASICFPDRDDPSLQIQPLVKSIIRRPIVRSFYIILNGNDDQLRKAASLLFNTDVSSLSAEEFVPYHQLLWLMTAIRPFEKCRIFALVCLWMV